jgi:hypothetical protein
VWWAREELNLRPLPCQIQRASTGLYVGGLETGKDHREAAGERRCQRPAASTVCHGSPRVVVIPTAVSCCPFAADALLVTFGSTIFITCLHRPDCMSRKAGDVRLP